MEIEDGVQVWRHVPRAGLGICSFAQIAQDKWATVSESPRSLRTNKQLWANRSGRSWQKSNRERFAQDTHDKRANERIASFF